MMGKKDNFGANFLNFWTIKDKITGFCECKAVYASIYSSFNSFKKCLLFKVQTSKILPHIMDFQNSAPRYLGANGKVFNPVRGNSRLMPQVL